MRRVVARVGRAHGIHGEVSIEVRTDVPAERFGTGAVLVVAAPVNGSAAGVPERLTVQRLRDHNGTLLLSFTEIADRNTANLLRDHLLEADVDEDDTEDDAWYDDELIGLQATNPAGEILGSVVSLDVGLAQDRLVIRGLDGQDRLVPFVRQIVPLVDPQGGRVVIDAPPGLLNDADLDDTE
jgi:16S rRNA processing protein RimM